jgi:hypothetical protein
MLDRFVTLLALAAATPALGGPCTNTDAIWEAKGDKLRYVVYGTDGLNYFSVAFLEEWRGDKLAWRTTGRVSCSNGASICYLLLDRADGGEKSIEIIMEGIDVEGDDLTDWIVFAALGQSLWYEGDPKVKWYNGFVPAEGERIIPPNIYRFSACRSEALVPEPAELFALPALCEQYKATGKLEPDPSSQPPETYWWMRGTQITGAAGACEVKSFNMSRTATTSCAGGKSAELPYEYLGYYVLFDRQRLDLCE